MQKKDAILQDIQLLRNHKHIQQVQVKSLYQYEIVYFPSTLSNPYSQFKWHLKLKVSQLYPKIPPQIYFIDPIYHLNVDNQGKINMAILHSQWSTVNNFNCIIDQLDNLIDFPDSNNFANKEALQYFLNNQSQYFRRVDIQLENRKSQNGNKNSLHQQKSDCQKQLISGLNQMKLSKFSSFANTLEGKTSLPINLKYGQYNFLLNSPKQSCIEPINMKHTREQPLNQFKQKQKKILYSRQKLLDYKQLKGKQSAGNLNKQMSAIGQKITFAQKSQNKSLKSEDVLIKKKNYDIEGQKIEIITNTLQINKQDAKLGFKNQFVQINMVKNSSVWIKNNNKSFLMLKQERVNANQTQSFREQFFQLLSQTNSDNILDKTFELIQKLQIQENQEKPDIYTQRQKIRQKIRQLFSSIQNTCEQIKYYKKSPLTKILQIKVNSQINLLQSILELQYKVKLKVLQFLSAEITRTNNQ